MQRFRFRFASVQKVRRIEMDLQARVLALAMQDLSRIDAEIEGLRQAYRDEVLRLGREAVEKNFSEIQMGSQVSYRDELMRREKKALAERERALAKIEEERKKLVEREQRKKVFDKLEERDLETYAKESRKTEQAEMDEVASRYRGLGQRSEPSDV